MSSGYIQASQKTIISVGAIMNRPRAVIDRPYIRRMQKKYKFRACCKKLATRPFHHNRINAMAATTPNAIRHIGPQQPIPLR